MEPGVALSLDAVIVAVTDERPRILTVGSEVPAIPSGPLDPGHDTTLERGLRRWVCSQTGLEVGYVEQLYTFGDPDRRRRDSDPVPVSVAYLALVNEAQPSLGAAWLDWYELFPWEDHRSGRPGQLDDAIVPAVYRWAAADPECQGRVQINFGVDPVPWDPIRVLERYELLYEAGLVAEWYRDRDEAPPELLGSGRDLGGDHRRIAATALGRLRGKLTYRPVVLELLPETFTLTHLQRTVEALIGLRLPKGLRIENVVQKGFLNVDDLF